MPKTHANRQSPNSSSLHDAIPSRIGLVLGEENRRAPVDPHD